MRKRINRTTGDAVALLLSLFVLFVTVLALVDGFVTRDLTSLITAGVLIPVFALVLHSATDL